MTFSKYVHKRNEVIVKECGVGWGMSIYNTSFSKNLHKKKSLCCTTIILLQYWNLGTCHLLSACNSKGIILSRKSE